MRTGGRLAIVLAALIVSLVAAAPAAAAAPSVGPVTATEGAALPASTTIATFSDGVALPFCSGASGYTATVNWGDGSAAAAATVTGPINPSFAGPCNYSVAAGHTYAEAVPSHDAVTVDVTRAGGGPGSGSGTATVADAPLTAGAPGGIQATENATFSGTVATFSDNNTGAPARDFTATITWGDGATSTGTVSATGTAGQFVVTGTHTYAEAGGHTTSVAVTDVDGSSVSLPGTATVSDAPLTAGTAFSITATTATPFAGPVATFTDGNTAAPAGDFTATITWGDGTSSSGTVTATATAGQFTVSGTHTFTTAGTLSTSVLVNDADSASVAVPGSAFVTAAAAFGPASAVEGTALPSTTTIATFSDGFDVSGCTAAATYIATVNWGDGSTTEPAVVTASGTPSVGQPCTYQVSAGHTYAEGGNDTVAVTATGGGLSGGLSGSFNLPVSDAGLTAASSVALQATGGVPFTGTVGGFTDANTGAPAGDFTATINWGDGTTSSGTVTGTAGQFSISGTHTFNGVGALRTSVVVTDTDGATVTVPGVATVAAPAPPQLTAVSTSPVSARAGVTVTATLGTFADADPGTTAASYKAAIAWGDGAVTLATIVSGSVPGQFGVQGSHRYSAAGTFKIKIIVAAPLGRVVELDTTATITPIPPTLALSVRSLNLSPGPALSASIACGSSDTSCRGYVSAYVTFHGRRGLGRSLFIIPGGRSATFVFPIPASVRRHLRHATLSVSASGSDPSKGLSGRASKTIPG
jgi:hypothetical protein